jgi:hypothetical protein
MVEEGICFYFLKDIIMNERRKLMIMIKGFGGIFWRTKNLEATKKWYSEVLKIKIENWNGISEFGKFIWIEDPDGRLVELWEK